MTEAHPRRRLPPLRSIQVFEAAARLGSFTAAAHELGVTQGAVSRQIQQLEAQLETPLFLRSGPNLSLTEAGGHLAGKARQALKLLTAATEAVSHRKESPSVTITMLPSVAAKWFAPRLSALTRSLPGVDIRLSTARELVDLRRDGVDLALRYGRGAWAQTRSFWLGDETVFPVCSPAYAERLGLRRPTDLARGVLLHSDIEEDWAAWFEAADLSPDGAPNGPILTDDATIVQAAVDGQGVALGRSRLVQTDLAAGRLIAPFDVSLPASYSYWLVRAEDAVDDPIQTRLTAWFTEAFLEQEAPRPGSSAAP